MSLSASENRMKAALDKRRSDDKFRSLKITDNKLIDFSSSDYLGFARSIELKNDINNHINHDIRQLNGSTGSRLLTGNSKTVIELEHFIADYHHAESALLFNSGYDANLGFFSSVPSSGDLVIYDELVHASVHDGMRLSRADSISFRHNDLEHLEALLARDETSKFVAVESVYSMDGDFAKLESIVMLCNKYGAHLVVDEAHATGLFGPKGKGLVSEYGLEKHVFARLHTYGKAMGCHGAAILGSPLLKEYLTNYARSFIYSTSMPHHAYFSIKCAYDKLSVSDDTIKITSHLVNLYKEKITSLKNVKVILSDSPIQCIIVPGNKEVRRVSAELATAGYDVRALVSPTVESGKERLRICIHAFNNEAEIIGLIETLDRVTQPTN